MPDSYPYTVANNKLKPIIDKIRSAARPTKFTHDFLKKIGFVSSNDRAAIGVLKRLGFLTEEGAPTQYYDELKDPSRYKAILAERIRHLYAELFTVDEEIYKATDEQIKGAIARVTGKDEVLVQRYFATFKTLTGLADFTKGSKVTERESPTKTEDHIWRETPPIQDRNDTVTIPGFHYNIQIHLPNTTDISVYNAIFSSLKAHLLG